MFKKKYDLAFGVGAACSCTQVLRAAGLQYLSFPFDWVFGATIEDRVDCICEHFSEFLNITDLEFLQVHPFNGKDIYVNKKTGIVFNHDFPSGIPLSQGLTGVKLKYDRRSARLLSLIEKSNRILVLWVGHAETNEQNSTRKSSWKDAAEYIEGRLCRSFGDKFDLLLFQHKDGVRMDKREVVRYSRRVTKVAFDFKSKKMDAPGYAINTQSLVWLLKKRFRVKDYRTDAEKNAYISKNIGSSKKSKNRVWGIWNGVLNLIQRLWGIKGGDVK